MFCYAQQVVSELTIQLGVLVQVGSESHKEKFSDGRFGKLFKSSSSSVVVVRITWNSHQGGDCWDWLKFPLVMVEFPRMRSNFSRATLGELCTIYAPR